MITIATLFWAPNKASEHFSRRYTEEWADKLYRGFARNLTLPFRFVCFTDRERAFAEPIEQERITLREGQRAPDYSNCIEPYRLDVPMILVGLDTVVTGNCDALADYCLSADVLAVPRDPYAPRQACNGVAFVPAGKAERMWSRFDGRNDMEWVRANPHAFIDDLFPGAVKSYKVHCRRRGPEGASIVYFHGIEKPGEIKADWIAEHWR